MSVQTPAAPRGAAVEDLSYESLGRPIAGPGALAGNWRRFWHLTFNLALMEWRLKFFGSALGYLWQLVHPLLLFLVLYVFFVDVAKIGVGEGPSYDYYGAQLLGAIVLFTFFGEATAGAVRCVVDHEALVRKIQFPRLAIPLANVLLASFNLGLNLVVVTIFTLLSGVTPMLTWLELVPIVLLLMILCTGIAMLLASLFVYARDVEPIWAVVSQVLFYASPIIIAIVPIKRHLTHISPALMHIYMLNPLAVVFQEFKHAFITHATPSAASLLGSYAQLAEPVAIVLAVFVFGFWVFNRIAPHVAEDL